MMNHSSAEVPELGLTLRPEAYDALCELASEWRVDVAEAYRRMLWIAADPEQIARLETEVFQLGAFQIAAPQTGIQQIAVSCADSHFARRTSADLN